jgi:hypothetical protein
MRWTCLGRAGGRGGRWRSRPVCRSPRTSPRLVLRDRRSSQRVLRSRLTDGSNSIDGLAHWLGPRSGSRLVPASQAPFVFAKGDIAKTGDTLGTLSGSDSTPSPLPEPPYVRWPSCWARGANGRCGSRSTKVFCRHPCALAGGGTGDRVSLGPGHSMRPPWIVIRCESCLVRSWSQRGCQVRCVRRCAWPARRLPWAPGYTGRHPGPRLRSRRPSRGWAG